ncbi:MAG TPA: ribosome silencing factor [Abditibacteriaceae bacterium]|nr:ribosome silencing factor [Abditibacteriaceae bacterium]
MRSKAIAISNNGLDEAVAEGASTPSAPDATAQDEASRRKLREVCAILDEQKAQDVVILDVREQTTLADYFVICSGTSATHIRSIAEGVQDRLREQAKWRAKAEGDAASFWVILDYGDVILHIFDAPMRGFYDLERLWADAPALECQPDQL